MAISLRLSARLTDDDIRDLAARNPGLQIEQATSGELILTPTGAATSRRESALDAQLYNWAIARGTGPTPGSREACRSGYHKGARLHLLPAP